MRTLAIVAAVLVATAGCTSSAAEGPSQAPSITASQPTADSPYGTAPLGATDEASLTVTPVQGPTVTFDASCLRALPQTSIQTTTPDHWLNLGTGLPATQEFSGVPLSVVLREAGIPKSADVELTGADGYRQTARVRELIDADALLAITADGDPISVAQGGPLRTVYPTGSPQEQDYAQWMLWLTAVTQA